MNDRSHLRLFESVSTSENERQYSVVVITLLRTHGRPLTKKNCRSVFIRPQPGENLDIRPWTSTETLHKELMLRLITSVIITDIS